LTGTGLPKRMMAAVNFEGRFNGVKPSILLIHYTGMNDAEKACGWLCAEESRVSCHYLVDEAGAITQMVSEELRAWHAGVSSWQGVNDINSHSIGIEIQNPGHNGGYPDFPAPQMDAVGDLARDIVARWKITPRRVLAHSDVAPGRKIDPGEKFDWAMLHRQGIGHWVEPAPISEGRVLQKGMDGEAVRQLQQMLKSYGYGVDVNGVYDQRTMQVVDAFQRHFRPALVDGRADQSTVMTLERLAGWGLPASGEEI
jgi:N-acetylmuramoyl-L-alanine amidase